MNEDERGITPANVTAMTIESRSGEWWVVIEQGNGDVIKEITLTDMERIQLAMMLGEIDGPAADRVSFTDYRRVADELTRLGEELGGD